ASKGDTVGEQIYWAINRSTDMTVGTIYYSARGWERTAAIRHRGLGQDFLRANYNAPSDHGQTRLVADVEYLSSFPYREAFSSNFNQAVSSDVLSDLYALHERNGMAISLE